VKARKRISCRGTVTLETALVLSLILLPLTFAAIEYGWLFLKSQQIANAARNGARVGIRYGAIIPNDVTATIDTLMTAAGMDKSKSGYTVSFPTPPSLPYSKALTVRIVVPRINIDVMNLPLLPKPDTLGASVTMAKEGP